MTINFQSLRCSECGSTGFDRTGPNQYTCQHCKAVSVVEDDVSERLDHMLDQVKDAAAARMAAEQSVRNQQLIRNGAIALAAVALFFFLAVFLGVFSRHDHTPAFERPVIDRTIPLDGLKMTDVRQVLVGSGSSVQTKLLVVARNETGKPLSGPRIGARLYDGDNNLGERSESLPVSVLQPGESAPVLFHLPGDRTVTRQDLTPDRLSEPRDSVAGEVLRFTKVRLVAQGDDVRLVGRVRNPLKEQTLAGVQVLVMLYDASAKVIGFGRAYVQGSELKPGEQSAVELRLERFGGKTAIAAWDYRIEYNVLKAGSGRTAVLVPERVVRTVGGPEGLSDELRQSVEDLLAEDAERFDLAQIELLPLTAARDNTQDLIYLTELVNRSTDVIAVSPALVVTQFDGNRSGGRIVVGRELMYLYPGERLPVSMYPRNLDRVTQIKTEWKPMRRAALPGPRVPLEVRVTGTQAKTSSMLVNFSRRYVYPYADVSGTVTNPGKTIVRKVKLWVSLRDREGKLTGFKVVDNLPPLPPGESVPFQVNIEQWGRNFTSVTTLYQTQ